jgi:hypothetical protein
MSNDQSLEQQITALGLTAPRITPAQIDAMVDALGYHTYVIPGTTTTVAAAIDKTGFVVSTGFARSIASSNFDEVFGRNTAIGRAKSAAREALWELEGYRLRRNLAEASKVGLIAGLEAYAQEGLRDDLLFVGDLATGFCVASINASPAANGEQGAP